MFCRAAWQKLAPLARRTLTPFTNAVFPARPMSFGLPASGTNIAYVVLGGSSLTAALVYAYKTINSDSARYNERIAQLEARPKRAVVEIASVEAAAVVEAIAADEINAEAEQTPEPVEAATAIVEAVAAGAEEPTAPVVEDVTAEAAATVAETTVIPMSDLLSTVKILAGSTAEIAAASVGDQHLVSAVRLAEENNSMETINGLELTDVKAEVPAEVPEEAVTDEDMTGRLNLKTEENELNELPASLNSVEDIVVADDHVKSDADSLAWSDEALVTEMENILQLDDLTSPVMTLSEDDPVSGAAEMTSETVQEGQKMEECKTCCEPTENVDVTAPPADAEESLQATGTTEAAEVVTVMETLQEAVEKAKPVEASDEADEDVSRTVTQA